MPIERIGEFLISDDGNFGPSLGIESDQLDLCIKEAQSKNIISLFGSPEWGFKHDNLNFLAHTPKVESVNFSEINLKNIDGLYLLKNLRFILVDGKRPGIDFEPLPNIESIVWPYNKKDTNLATLKSVQNFYLWNFNPKSKSFSSLVLPSTIKKLEVNWANPATLDGLPSLPSLREIEFHYCRNLKSLSGLERISPGLERIVVARCKRLDDLDALGQLKKLKDVFVNDKRLTR